MGRHQGAAALSSWFWSVFDGLYPLNLLIYAFLWPLLELLFLFRVRRFLCLAECAGAATRRLRSGGVRAVLGHRARQYEAT